MQYGNSNRSKTAVRLLWGLIGIFMIILIAVVVFLSCENQRLKKEHASLKREYQERLEQKKKREREQLKKVEDNQEKEEQGREIAKVVQMPEGTEEVPWEAKPSASEDGQGRAEPIPEEIRESMKGISMPEGTTRIGFDDLSYLTLPHYDFEGRVVDGHMIVNRDVAEDVIHIFKELYDIQYPIQRMELIDKFDSYMTERFDSLDRSSMGRNNTSCFCYRVINGSQNMSNHAWGRAIDLNPLINPWVQGDYVSPRNAERYKDRSQVFEDEVINRATIHANDEVVQIFEKYGWNWGGYWENQKDYQHFEKVQ